MPKKSVAKKAVAAKRAAPKRPTIPAPGKRNKLPQVQKPAAKSAGRASRPAARPPAVVPEVIAPPRKKRDHSQEAEAAKLKSRDRIMRIVDDKQTGKLGEDVFKFAKALLVCSLPYQQTKERQISRTAQMGKDTTLTVTMTAARPNTPLPFGRDRDMLHWIIDRAIQSRNPYVEWNSALEYLKETQKSDGGDNYKLLRSQFERISGVVIHVSAEGSGPGVSDQLHSIIEKSYLPKSIAPIGTGAPVQQSLPELADRYGFQFNQTFFDETLKNNIALPRQLWMRRKGSMHVQDLVTFLLARCHAARSQSVIPWADLQKQFPNADTNKGRFRQHVRTAIRELRSVWVGVRIEALAEGVWVDKAAQPLLPDDIDKNRVRRLS